MSQKIIKLFDGDEDDDEVTFEPIKRFQKGPRKMKKD